MGRDPIQAGRRAVLEPPSALEVSGTVYQRLVVVGVRSAKLHPVRLKRHMAVIVESVPGVALVTGHLQPVVVAL